MYRDRGLRYIIWIDGNRQKPSLAGNSSLVVDINAGSREIWVSVTNGRRANAVTLLIPENGVVNVLLLPRRPPFWRHRCPLVVDDGSRAVIPGRFHELDAEGRRETQTVASHEKP